MKGIIIKTKYGQIEGVEEGFAYVFKGIPYAKPPIKELRFKAPQKPDNFVGVYKADKFRNRSAQAKWETPDNFYDKEFYMDNIYKTSISEDSLYLNIWTPKINTDKKLPVLFYIHGGAFMGGTGHEMEFRTDAYAEQGIILVTINYRLGAFGFFAHEWLNDNKQNIGNFGVLDQIAALDWVRENISSFGGDFNNITICGQSAGAMSVEVLLCSPLADGKFNKAIIQSASGYPQLLTKGNSLEKSMLMGQKLVYDLKVNTLAELQEVPTERILEAQQKLVMEIMQKGEELIYAPIVDGYVLRETIDKSVENGNIAKVPMIIGSTKEDITVTKEEAELQDSKINKSCIEWSLMNEKINENPSYVYYFKRDLPGDNAGAFHSAELWYMFGTLDKCWRPMEKEDFNLSKEMILYWSNFIKSSNPNGEGLELWEKCTENNRFVKKFDKK